MVDGAYQKIKLIKREKYDDIFIILCNYNFFLKDVITIMHFRNSCQSCDTGKEGDENQVVSVHLEMFEIAFTYKGPNKVCNTPIPPWTTDHRNFGLSSYYKNICFKKLKILINCG